MYVRHACSFDAVRSVSGTQQCKTSVARNIRKSLIDVYPQLDTTYYADEASAAAASSAAAAAAAAGGDAAASSVSDASGGESHLDRILGDKKQPLYMVKCHDRVNLITVNKVVQFLQSHDDQWLPTLRLLHQCMCARCCCCTAMCVLWHCAQCSRVNVLRIVCCARQTLTMCVDGCRGARGVTVVVSLLAQIRRCYRQYK